MSLVSIPLMGCSIILAPQIIFILSGPGYEGAIFPMRIIMPAVLLVGIAQVLAVQVLMPMKKDKVLLKASCIGAFVSVIINLFIVPDVKSIGTAIVLLCSEITVTSIYIGYVLLYKLVSIPFIIVFKSIFYSLPYLFTCFLFSEIIENIFLLIILSIILTIILLFIIYKREIKK